jgi:hypothetical protein
MNIRDCIILAREDPATLVRTLEVIEMEDRASVKVFSHTLGQVKKSSASSESDDSDSDGGHDDAKHAGEVVTMRKRCFEELETSIAEHFAQQFHDRKEVPAFARSCVKC